MDTVGIIFTVILGVAAVIIALYFLGKHLQKKQNESQQMIDQNRQMISAFVIDKGKMKLSDANFPKGSLDQIPWYLKNRKMPMAKVKVGPQMITMLVENKIYKALPTKRNMKLEVAGAYIMNFSTAKKGEKEIKAPEKKTMVDKLKEKTAKLRSQDAKDKAEYEMKQRRKDIARQAAAVAKENKK